MTKLSRLFVDPENFQYFLNNFWSIVTLLEDKDQVKDFLKDLLTPTEMKMFAKRVQIAKMLIEGYSYHEIKGKVKVTDTTIAKISNTLSIDGKGLKHAIYLLQKIEKEIEGKKLQAIPDLKKKYGIYFLPEKLIGEAAKTIKVTKKRNSVKRKF